MFATSIAINWERATKISRWMLADDCTNVPHPRYLVVDETGAGRPVVEMLGHLQPHGITITGTGKPVLTAPMHANVPKRDLVGAAQVALQNGILKIGRILKHADTLGPELLAFRAKISDSGHDTYSAWRLLCYR